MVDRLDMLLLLATTCTRVCIFANCGSGVLGFSLYRGTAPVDACVSCAPHRVPMHV